MTLCLLLSRDSSLQSEVESGLAQLSPSPTLLILDHDRNLAEALESLSDVGLVIVDHRHFTPPPDLEVPIVLLDGADSPPGPTGHPGLVLPIRPAELSSLVHYLLKDARTFGSPAGHDPLAFFQRVQKEVLHDLNNRQTTLQGHLPLLTEACQGEVNDILSDMCVAADQTGRLLKLLEAMDPDATCSPEPVSVTHFLKQLSGLSRRILPKSAPAEFQFPDVDSSIVADEAVLAICLLTGLDALALSHRGPVALHTQQEAGHLRIQVHPTSAINEIEVPPPLLTRINQRLHPMRAKVTAVENGLVYTLKTAHQQPTPE